jgi:hypothetical protein
MAEPDKKPLKRPTEEEEQEREDFAFELLSRCLHKSQIKKQFIARYEVTARTVEKYLSRARERMVAEARQGRDDLRAESLSFYYTILRSGEATPREKISARERIDRLFGLDMPIKIAPTSVDGEKSYRELTDEELNQRILEKLGQGAQGGMVKEA